MPFTQLGRDFRAAQVSEEKREVDDFSSEDDGIGSPKSVETPQPSEPTTTTTVNPVERVHTKIMYDDTSAEIQNEYYPTGSKVQTRNGGSIREEHKNPIYAVAWSTDVFSGRDEEGVQRFFRCFASVAGNRANVYEVEVANPEEPPQLSHRSGKFVLKQSYYDPTPKEDLYAVAFGGRSFCPLSYQPTPSHPTKKIRLATDNNDDNVKQEESKQQQVPFVPVTDVDIEIQDPTGPLLLCVGGKAFNIKVIDTARKQLWMTLSGHGEEITSLKFSPIDSNMLLSTSNDRSCRIWNVRTGTNIAVLAGHHGHRDIVMYASWHLLGGKIVSGGHDTLVKIWNVGEGTPVHEAMQQSYKVPLQVHKNGLTVEAANHFAPVVSQFPIFSTNRVHLNPVDCVEFVGDLVLSKASDVMVLWDPDYRNPDGNPKVTLPPPERLEYLRRLKIPNIDWNVMFYRFCTSADGRFVAVGNMEAEVWLMDIDDYKGKSDKLLNLRQRDMTTVRMTSFSPDGRMLLCCCDDGGIWKWDIFRN